MRKTVFVVGAGASTEFGDMPVGDTLARETERLMLAELNSGSRWPEGPISNALAGHGGLDQRHISAMQTIRDRIQSCPSIDEFINEWQDVPFLPDICKLAIAQIIFRAERSSVLAAIENEDTIAAELLRKLENSWLGITLSRLSPGLRRRDIQQRLENVAFITFNYDRCIEQYLMASFKSTYGMSENDAEELLTSTPVFHVYGDLGSLPKGRMGGVEFGASDRLVPYAARSIRTFTEEVATDHASRIQSTIRAAEKIVFLGCAYHKQNIQVLFGPKADLHEASIWGTSYLMRPISVERARGMLPTRYAFLEEVKASELLIRNSEPIFER